MITKKSRIFLSGHNGMVGSAVLRKLKNLKYKNIFLQTRKQLDLRNQSKVYKYLSKIKPDAKNVVVTVITIRGPKRSLRRPITALNVHMQKNINEPAPEMSAADQPKAFSR